MNAFVFMPIWCAIIWFISTIRNFSTNSLVEGNIVVRYQLGFAFFAFFPMIFITTIGEPCNDVVSYLENYKNLVPSFSSVHLKENGWGFTLFSVIIKKVFGSNPIPFRIFIALIQSIPIIFLFRRYSENYLLSLFVFVASAVYLSWMMNGLRQFMAVAILLTAIPYLIEKKYFKVCFIVLIATVFHQTAIIMLPILLIVRGKIFNKYTMFFIILSIAAMAMFSLNSDLFETTISSTEYSDGYDYIKEIDDGINPIRVLVNAIPVVLAFFSKAKLKAEDNMFNNIAINLSMITLGVSLVAMVTSGIYVGRLIIYTQLYGFAILPKLISITFDKKSKNFVYLALIFLYLIYYKRELGNFYYYDFDVFGGLK